MVHSAVMYRSQWGQGNLNREMRFFNPGWTRLFKRLAGRAGLRRREPWEKLKWTASSDAMRPRTADVVFSVRNFYQIKELSGVNEGLLRHGLKTVFLDHSLNGNSPAANEARAMGLPVSSLRDFAGARLRPGLLLVRTDSDKCSRLLLEYARNCGIPTAAIAHPLINFQRKPNQFRMPDHVMCSGRYTAKRIQRDDIEITGFPYFDQFLDEPRKPGRSNLVLVNLALPRGLGHVVPEIGTYRRIWVEEVLDAAKNLGLDSLVSIHPRDTGLRFDWPVNPEPIDGFLQDAAVVVSPPSTVMFTAMALGIPVACHQSPPLKARMPDAFDEPHGAFRISENLAEITKSIEEAVTSQSNYRKKSHQFFSQHISVMPERSMTERTVEAIIGILD